MNEFDYLAKAKNNMEKAKFHEVISLCGKALKINSELPDAYDFRANAKYEIGEYDSAIDDFDELIKRDPNEAMHYYDRAWAYRQLDELEDAIIDINSAIKLEPKTSLFYYDKARFEYDSNRYKEAIVTCTKAIELKPTENKYILRGKIYREIGNNQKSLIDFDKALDIEPEAYRAYYYRGTVKMAMGCYDDAVKDFEKTIEICPNYYDAYIKIGMAKVETGQKDGMKYFNKVIKLSPECADFYKLRFVARQKIIKREQVLKNLSLNKDINFDDEDKVFSEKQAKADIKDITKVLSFEPDDIVSYAYRAKRYEFLNKYDKAIADYTMLISLDSEESWHYVMRAHCLELNGRYKEAVEDCNKALDMNNGYGNVLIFSTRGISNYKLGNFADAYNDFSVTLDETQDSEIFYYRALTNLEFRNFFHACDDFAKAIEIEPEIESKMDEKIPLLIGMILAFRNGFNKDEKITKKQNDLPIGLNGIK